MLNSRLNTFLYVVLLAGVLQPSSCRFLTYISYIFCRLRELSKYSLVESFLAWWLSTLGKLLMCHLISSFSVSFELALWLCFPLFSASHVPRLFFLVSAVATNLSDISRVSRNIFLQTFTFFSWICRKYSYVELLLERFVIVVFFPHFSGLCCISIFSAVSNNPFSKNCEKFGPFHPLWFVFYTSFCTIPHTLISTLCSCELSLSSKHMTVLGF